MQLNDNAKKSLETRIMKSIKVIISIILIPPLVYGCFVGIFFFIVPMFYEDSQKLRPEWGYSHPLSIVDDDAKYTIVYYTGHDTIGGFKTYWTVIDDQEAIRKYKDTFVVYLNDAALEGGAGRFYYVLRNEETVLDGTLSYFPECMIYDDFFEPYKKIFTMEEMREYAYEHGFSIVIM